MSLIKSLLAMAALGSAPSMPNQAVVNGGNAGARSGGKFGGRRRHNGIKYRKSERRFR